MNEQAWRSRWLGRLGELAVPATAEEEGTWPSIRDALFEGRELKDGTGLIALEAPKRAQDAAVVPVTVKALQPQTPERYIKTVHLIVDENPAPVAGVFHLYPQSGDATIGTRIRVDQYTNLHAVAETSDGELYVVERFIKAAGGCSAPGLKDKELAMARLGKMQLKPMTPFRAGRGQRAQLLISHPNYTGMQIDQLTRLWIPPDYVQLGEGELRRHARARGRGRHRALGGPRGQLLLRARRPGADGRPGRGQRGPQVRAVLADRPRLLGRPSSWPRGCCRGRTARSAAPGPATTRVYRPTTTTSGAAPRPTTATCSRSSASRASSRA